MSAIGGIGGGKEFASSSVGYQAIKLASEGAVDKLRALIPGNLTEVSQVHRVRRDNPVCFSPLHYALKNQQWKSSALLLNQGVSWEVLSVGHESPVSPIDLLNRQLERSLVPSGTS